MDARQIRPAVYAIPFERVWESVQTALREEGAEVERVDDTVGVVEAHGSGGFPRQRWGVEVRVRLDSDGQTQVDLTHSLLQGLDLGRSVRRARRLMQRIDQGAGATEQSRLLPRDTAGLMLLGCCSLFAGCAPDAPPVEEPSTPTVAEEAPVQVRPLRTYERAFALHASDGDSTLAAVWLFDHADLGTAVSRHARGLLLRGGSWESFMDTSVEDPPSESPWRLLPSGPLRLVVGSGDRVERVVYEEDERLLELDFRGGGASWTGRRGGSFSVEDAAIVLGDRAVPGLALDLSRAWRPDEAPTGDWAFLTSGDSIAIVLQAPRRSRDENAWQGWILRGDEEILIPEVTLTWAETRAFDDARRDIPIAWSLTTSEAELTGSFQMRAADLRALPADGPLLPVRGVFDVTGAILLGDVERPIEGIMFHAQGGGG